MKKPYIQLSETAQQQIFMDVQQRNSIEACGVLLGSIDTEGNWLVEEAQPLSNTAESSAYFEFDPEELLQTELKISQQIVGVYHSHPSGYPVASDTDCQNMQRVNQEQLIPWAWIIVRGPFSDGCTEQAQRQPETADMIAYHYYAQEGLQQVTICVDASSQIE